MRRDHVELRLGSVDEHADPLLAADGEQRVDVGGVRRGGNDERALEVEEAEARRRHVEADDAIAVGQQERFCDLMAVTTAAHARDQDAETFVAHATAPGSRRGRVVRRQGSMGFVTQASGRPTRAPRSYDVRPWTIAPVVVSTSAYDALSSPSRGSPTDPGLTISTSPIVR